MNCCSVQGYPSLKGALLIGNGRVQSALIVEPREPMDEAGRVQLLETLWPRIEEANTHVSGQGRVARGMAICASPDKPFARTGKGTVVRKSTEEAYRDEIEHLYSSSTRQDKLVTVGLKATTKTVYEIPAITNFLRQVLAVSFTPASTFGEDEDFFAHGLDSVQTLEITANLKRNLEGLTSNSVAWVSPRTIFRYSTLAGLSQVLVVFLNDGRIPSEDSETARASAVDQAVARHVENLPLRTASRVATASVPASGSTVAIIGSTGYVGSHLVATLLKNPAISHVYCLNRGSDASARQKAALGKLGENLNAHLSRLTFFKIELGAPRLGLSQEQYQQVADGVSVVVYNSWRLDFGLAIHSFDPFLRATRDLVELSVGSQRNMRIVFVSSISSVDGLALTGSTVPEAPVEDPLAAMNTGYGQSKLAAERILAAAQRQSGIPVSIVRVGQVGGASHGDSVWADQAWISAIIHTSKTLGFFPSPVAPIDWVPVDTVATILESVILQPAQETTPVPQFFNVASEPQSWSLLANLLPDLGFAGVPNIVPLPDWVEKLRQVSSPSAAKIQELPALRLLDFYEGLGSGTDSLKYATACTREVSGVELAPPTRELLTSWLKSWDL